MTETDFTLSNTLLANFTEIESELRAIRMTAQMFEMADYVDIIHVTKLIQQRINNKAVIDAAGNVITAVKTAIVRNGSYGAGVSNANGLSVWYPATKSLYFCNRAKYMALRCNSSQFGWTSFLDVYHQ